MNKLQYYIQEKLNRTKSSLMLEKLKIGSKTKIDKYEYHIKDKDELMKLLDKLIKERGYDGDFNDIDTSEITDMSCLFTFSRNRFNGDISNWDVSKVTDMKFKIGYLKIMLLRLNMLLMKIY